MTPNHARAAPARHAIAMLLGVAALSIGGCAGYRYGAEVEVSNAPPPRIYFQERPRYDVVRGVYVIDPDAYGLDCDVFSFEGYWYAYSGQIWYRARSYNGPYVEISVERVPDRIFEVPAGRWKHHPLGGPPGQRKKEERHRDRYDWES